MVSDLSLRIPGGAGAATEARRVLKRLHSELPPDLLQTAALLASELVSNAVRHARAASVGLRAEVIPGCVRVEVTDDGAGFEPRPLPPDPARRSGWGLLIVDELASRWGVTRGPRTRVWFEIDR